ncbi:MAG: hypothetical protein A2284_09880 [Deltaproteobacteria bacterium RIFOXYA12_FULL_61_11]|nr:MAG: hypothetical protein A2284_09880 [Deltaproteobacteria bacterium RIFOXYA12_FULL_61_11]
MLSIILPVYNEAPNLLEMHAKLTSALDTLGRDYEIVYVDDGSRDGSTELLAGFASPRVRVIELARNYGQTEAMQAGIDHANGDILIFLDADLQNDPSDIATLVAKLEEGYDLVSGWRRHRQDSWLFRRLPSLLANRLITGLNKTPLHDLGCTLKAYRRSILGPIRLHGEMHRLLPLYAIRRGARLAEVEVLHHPRSGGRSKYGLGRTPKVLLDLLTATFINHYFNKPMYVFGMGGILLLFLGVLTGCFIIVRTIYFGGTWVSPMLFLMTMCILIGFQFLLMGLLAEIMIRLYYRNTEELSYSVRRSLGGSETDRSTEVSPP